MAENNEKKEIIPDITGYLNVRNNTRKIYYEYFGKKDKEVVCLLNGLAMSTKSYYSVLHYLENDFDILLYDFFGQGESSKEDEEYDITEFAKFLKQIMDELNIDKIHLMGISYSAFVAVEFARLFPERLYTLTLSGGAVSYHYTFQVYQDLTIRFNKINDPKVFELYTHFLYEKLFGENFYSKVYGETMESMRQKFFDRYNGSQYCIARLTEAQIPYFERIKKDPMFYSCIKTPTLILTGTHDRILIPWMQEKITEIIPDTKLVYLEGSGHLTYFERPDIFWPNMIAFMKSKSTNYKL